MEWPRERAAHSPRKPASQLFPSPCAAATPPATRPAEPSPSHDSLAIRIAVFAALALYGASHWALLVEDAPRGRTLLVVLIATAGAAVLGLLGRARLPRAAVLGLAALVSILIPTAVGHQDLVALAAHVTIPTERAWAHAAP